MPRSAAEQCSSLWKPRTCWLGTEASHPLLLQDPPPLHTQQQPSAQPLSTGSSLRALSHNVQCPHPGSVLLPPCLLLVGKDQVGPSCVSCFPLARAAGDQSTELGTSLCLQKPKGPTSTRCSTTPQNPSHLLTSTVKPGQCHKEPSSPSKVGALLPAALLSPSGVTQRIGVYKVTPKHKPTRNAPSAPFTRTHTHT